MNSLKTLAGKAYQTQPIMTAPTCPGCYQAFVDDSAVADHLSDPTLPCGAWLALQDEQVPGVPLEPEGDCRSSSFCSFAHS